MGHCGPCFVENVERATADITIVAGISFVGGEVGQGCSAVFFG